MYQSDSKPANHPKAAMDPRLEDLYRVEMYLNKNGCSDFVYDEKLDIFCFPEDGRFAFCDEFADWALLKERGYLTF
jgi:hypothetical protein